MVKYETIVPGEWWIPKRKGYREQCCDCGLVHNVEYRVVDGKVEFRVSRNNRATAAVRKAFKFSKDI